MDMSLLGTFHVQTITSCQIKQTRLRKRTSTGFSHTLNLGFEKNVKREGELCGRWKVREKGWTEERSKYHQSVWGRRDGQRNGANTIKAFEGNGMDRGMGQIPSKRFFLNMYEVSCEAHYFVCLIYVNKRKNRQIYFGVTHMPLSVSFGLLYNFSYPSRIIFLCLETSFHIPF